MHAADLFQAPAELTRGNVNPSMKAVNATSSDLWKVPVDQLRFIEGFNGRISTPEYEAHIENITQSIIDNGFYQDKPIAGFVADEGGKQVIYVTDGHTRTIAVRRAIERGVQIETVPLVVKPNGTTMEDLTVALVKSNDGKAFTPYETAVIVKRLIDMGMAEKDVAKRLGFTGQYVSDLLTLVGAPKAVRDLVIAGSVSATVATKAVKQHGSKATEKLKEAVSTAKAAGKSKATAKHMTKRPTLKIKGTVSASYTAGAKNIRINLDVPLDVYLTLGDKVRIVISESDEL